MVLPDSIRIVDVPDAELGERSLFRINRAASQYLAARALGEPGRNSPAATVRFIPHTPEERALWQQRQPKEPPPSRRPRAYTYRRSAVDAYTARRSSAATEQPTPAADVAVQGDAARKRRSGPRSRTESKRSRHSARRSGRSMPEPRRASPKPVKGRRLRSNRLKPDLSNLDQVIARFLGL